MIAVMVKVDEIDLRILRVLQRDGAISQREMADQVGLSQNACWRRLQRLTAGKLVKGIHAELDLSALGLDLTVFVMIRTRHHSREWAEGFRKHVELIAEVTDFYRIGGDWDYLIKVVTTGMSGYDTFYQKLITNFDLVAVTGFFSMEAIIVNRPTDLGLLRRAAT